VVAQEHWCSSGFANTDFGAELGYEVTDVKDATASYSDVEMHAALEVNIPNCANAIVSTDEILDAISQSKD
jgi:ureidoacrylate peracid hydrolase